MIQLNGFLVLLKNTLVLLPGRLSETGVKGSIGTWLCGLKDSEDVSHLFFKCCFTRRIWKEVLKRNVLRRDPDDWEGESAKAVCLDKREYFLDQNQRCVISCCGLFHLARKEL
ncbi:hypothetical protein LguiB_026386 [Lonicera macranthoides]